MDARYLESLRVKNYSERTVGNREAYLGFFIAWCEARSITRPEEVTKPILERYQRHLFHLRKRRTASRCRFARAVQRLVPVRALLSVADAPERPLCEPGVASSSCRGWSGGCRSTC